MQSRVKTRGKWETIEHTPPVVKIAEPKAAEKEAKAKAAEKEAPAK